MEIKNIYDKCVNYSNYSIYLGTGGLMLSSGIGVGKVIYDKYYLGIEKTTLNDLSNLETILIGTIIGSGVLALSGFLLNELWLENEGKKLRENRING